MENTVVKSDQIRAEIEQKAGQFSQAFNQGDARGVAAFYSEEGAVLPPNSDTVTGKQQIEAFWQGVMNMGVKQVRLQVLEAEQQEDTAFEVGRASLLGAEGQQLDEVKYLVVWKREDGDWKIYRDIFNSNTKL